MSDYLSETMTAQVAAETSSKDLIADARLLGGNQHFLQAHWLVPAGTAATETIDLCYLPEGHTLVAGATVTIDSAAGANTINLALEGGTVIATGIAVNVAGTFVIPMLAGNIVNTTKQKIIATIVGGAITAAKNIWFSFPVATAE